MKTNSYEEEPIKEKSNESTANSFNILLELIQDLDKRLCVLEKLPVLKGYRNKESYSEFIRDVRFYKDGYKAGWNEAMDDVMKYVKGAYSESTTTEIIGHCEASKR